MGGGGDHANGTSDGISRLILNLKKLVPAIGHMRQRRVIKIPALSFINSFPALVWSRADGMSD